VTTSSSGWGESRHGAASGVVGSSPDPTDAVDLIDPEFSAADPGVSTTDDAIVTGLAATITPELKDRDLLFEPVVPPQNSSAPTSVDSVLAAPSIDDILDSADSIAPSSIADDPTSALATPAAGWIAPSGDPTSGANGESVDWLGPDGSVSAEMTSSEATGSLSTASAPFLFDTSEASVHDAADSVTETEPGGYDEARTTSDAPDDHHDDGVADGNDATTSTDAWGETDASLDHDNDSKDSTTPIALGDDDVDMSNAPSDTDDLSHVGDEDMATSADGHDATDHWGDDHADLKDDVDSAAAHEDSDDEPALDATQALAAGDLPEEPYTHDNTIPAVEEADATRVAPAMAALTSVVTTPKQSDDRSADPELQRVIRDQRADRARALGQVAPTPDVVVAPPKIMPPSTYKAWPSLILILFRLIVAGVVGLRVVQELGDLPGARQMWADTIIPSSYTVVATWAYLAIQATIVVLLVFGLGVRVAGALLLLVNAAVLALVTWGGGVSFLNDNVLGFTGEIHVILAAIGLLFTGVGGGGWGFDGVIERARIERKNIRRHG
jgi:uncharacterized membrane protein YphA (DoxX/SURF4 family)